MIVGTGSYVPERILTNVDLEKIVPTSSEWIYNTLGISERRVAGRDEYSSDLAVKAAERAISDAGLRARDIGMIIVATATPDRQAPSTACIVQDKLKAYNAVAFDLSAVCSGFLFGMSVATQFAGVYDNALVIGVDTFSKITDWSSRDCVFFGDGAGAAVITYGGLSQFKMYSDGRGKDSFTAPHGGCFKMNGREVYDTAVTVLPEAINKVLQDAHMIIDDIDYMIPHQPSIGILKETARRIGLPFSKVLTNMDKYANTAGASIPILLDEARRSGKLDGKTVLLAAVGSGWTWGAAIIKT